MPTTSKSVPLDLQMLKAELQHFRTESLKAELESFRKQSEQSMQREIQLLRESIAKQTVEEMKAMHHEAMQSHREIISEVKAMSARVEEKGSTNAIFSRRSMRSSRNSAIEEQPVINDDAAAAHGRVDGVEEGSSEKPLLGARAEPERRNANCLEKLVRSPKFDSMASLLVFLSVVFLAIQTDYMARRFLTEPPFVFRCIEIAFCTVFVLEIILRIAVYGSGFFCDRATKYWNLFDLALVSMQVVEVIITFENEKGRFPFAPFLRMLRIARMVRVTRFLRLVPELRTLIVQIFHSFLPLGWVFILVFLVTAVFAVLLTQVVTDYKVKFEEEYRDTEEEGMQHLHQFDNLLTSMLALYQTISDGKHWGELCEDLMEIAPALALPMIAYTFFVIFAFMNVVTSHFVEEALESARQDEKQQMLENLEDIFYQEHRSREDPDVELSEDQFLDLCGSNKKMQDFLEHLYNRKGVTADEVKDMRLFKILDVDGSGAISTQEVVAGCERLTRPPQVLDLAAFRHECLEVFFTLEDMIKDIKEKMNKKT